jgi:Ca2+-binding EF-hand superfamily protein
MKPKFEAAKAYLAKHNLEARLRDAMKVVINELPEDPVDFITKHLRQSETDAQIEVQSGKPKAIMLQSENLRMRMSQALMAAAVDGRLNSSLTKLSREQISVSREEQARQEVRQILLNADANGSLQQTMDSVCPPPFPTYTDKNIGGASLPESTAGRMFKDEQPQADSTFKVERGPMPSVESSKKPSTQHPAHIVRAPTKFTDEQTEEFDRQVREFEDDLKMDEIRKFKDTFTKFQSRDRTITKDSLAEVMRLVGQDSLTDWEVFQDVMLDIPDDATFTLPELLSLVVETKAEPDEEVQALTQAFHVFDRTGCGYVSVAEVRAVLKALGDTYTPKQVDAMIKQAGVNSAGKVKYTVFANVMVSTNPEGF